MMECARCVVMLDGEMSKYVDILRGVAQRCTLSPNLFKVYNNDTMGEDTVSGLMFADDFVGISATPEGLQKQTEKALLDSTGKLRVTANEKRAQ